MSSAPVTEIVTDAARLEALAGGWWDLWSRCPGATPFQSPAWLLPWWRHFHPGSLATIVVRNGGRLIALAPHYREDGEYGPRLLPVGISVSDYLDVLLDPAFTASVSAAVSEAALRVHGWETWELQELAPDAAALNLESPDGCRTEMALQSVCPVLLLPEGKEMWGHVLTSTQRRHLNLARNRACRRGGIELRRIEEGEVASFLDELERLHRSRWSSCGEEGVLADSRVMALHREAAPALCRAGLARFYLAIIAGKAVAAIYALERDRRLMLYLTGFDPDYAFESPGRILLAHVVDEAMREGMQELHFLRGRENYKMEWRPIEQINTRASLREDGQRCVSKLPPVRLPMRCDDVWTASSRPTSP